MRVKLSIQPPPAPTAGAVGPCPTLIQTSRTPRHWKFTQDHRTSRPSPPSKQRNNKLNLAKITFFLTLYLRRVFISFIFNTNYDRDHLDHFLLLSPWQHYVGRFIQLLGLIKKFIFPQSLRTVYKIARVGRKALRNWLN